MKRAIREYWRPFAAILMGALAAALVGGYILSNQRFYLPKWVPVVGSDFVDYQAELPTAQAITPGQGQTVNIAGVAVGELAKVDLVDGKAVVTMKIRRKYTPIYKDATVLVRPKTGLNDMTLELAPGSKSAGVLPPDQRIDVSRTLDNVDLDEVLQSLDNDTRDYLRLLLAGAGDGLRNNAANLSATFKRFEPTSRDLARIMDKLSERRTNIRRTVRNFRLLSESLAGKDEDLAQLVDASGAVFESFAEQDQNLRAALRELPSSLQTTRTALDKTGDLAKVLGPTLEDLGPTARNLGPSLRQTRPFLRDTTPVIQKQLRPFARAVQPVVKDLRPAARDLAAVTPDLTETLKVANYLLNTLAYDKPNDGQQSYLFWLGWANHLAPTLFAQGDAHGTTRRGLIVISCAGLSTLTQLGSVNGQLGLLFNLLDAPAVDQVCPQTSQPAGNGTSTITPPPTRATALSRSADAPTLAAVPQATAKDGK